MQGSSLELVYKLTSTKMNQELVLAQISHRTYSVTLRNVSGEVIPPLVHLLKHKGQWNPIIRRYEYPLARTQALLADIARNHPQVTVKDVPLSHIKGILSHSSGLKDDKKVVFILPRHKWHRMLVLDPSLVKRQAFLLNFMGGPGQQLKPNEGGRQQPTLRHAWRRCLILCSESMLGSWQSNMFQRHKLSYKPVDYQSLSLDQHYKIRSLPLKEHQFEVLTYERLAEIGALSKHIVNKYHTIVCDDSEIWIRNSSGLAHVYRPASQLIHDIMTKSLKEFGPEKDLLLFVSKLRLNPIEELLDVLALLKPHNFGTDPLLIAKGQLNDATWMKKRYGKNSKYGQNIRELVYLLGSSVLVNLGQDQPKLHNTEKQSDYEGIRFIDSWINVTFGQDELYKLRSLDSRHKNVNKKALLSSLQTHRTIGTHALNSSHPSDEAKYLKDLRQTISTQKLKEIFRWLFHITVELSSKVAVVVQNSWGFEILQKFLREQQIPYVVYQISYKEILKNQGFNVFNCSSSKVCLLVRDRLANQYHAANIERERHLEEGEEKWLETELGLERGGAFQLAQHCPQGLQLRDGLRGLSNESPLNLQKVTTVRHVLFLDVFWHDFSALKERIVMNIFNWKLGGCREWRINEERSLSDDGMITDWQPFYGVRGPELARHYWVVKDSYQSSILQKYLINLEGFQEEQEELLERVKQEQSGVGQFWGELLKRQEAQLQGLQKFEGIYDVDQEFDKLQYEALQEEHKLKEQQDQPVYNTSIPGLLIETPRVDELPILKQQQSENTNGIELIAKQNQPHIADLSWLDESQTSREDIGEPLPNLDKYLVVPQGAAFRCNERSKQEIDTRQAGSHKISVSSSGNNQARVSQSLKVKKQGSSPPHSLEYPKMTANTFVEFKDRPQTHKKQLHHNSVPLQNILQRLQPLIHHQPVPPRFNSHSRHTNRNQSQVYLKKERKRGCWGSRTKQKVIGKVKKVLKVKLVPLKSCLTCQQ